MKKGETKKIDLPADVAERVWIVRLHPILCACAPQHDDMLRSFGLSCYLQGVLDASSPEYQAAAASLLRTDARP